MGKIYNEDGRIGWRVDDANEARYPIPDAATDILEIDFEANRELLEGIVNYTQVVHKDGNVDLEMEVVQHGLNTDCNNYTINKGRLLYKGEPVQIAQASKRSTDRKTAALLQGAAVDNLTAAQQKKLLVLLLEERGYVATDGTIDFRGHVRADTAR